MLPLKRTIISAQLNSLLASAVVALYIDHPTSILFLPDCCKDLNRWSQFTYTYNYVYNFILHVPYIYNFSRNSYWDHCNLLLLTKEKKKDQNPLIFTTINHEMPLNAKLKRKRSDFNASLTRFVSTIFWSNSMKIKNIDTTKSAP